MSKCFNEYYSKYYDCFYTDKNYKKEVEYLIKLIDKYGRNSNKLIDIACGTGNHLIHFLKKGFEIDGSDISENMINLCKSKIAGMKCSCAYKPEIKVKSMLDINTRKKYNVVFCLFAAINYLNGWQEIESLLKKLNKILQPGGLFIFDFWNGLIVPQNDGSERDRVFKINNSLQIKRYSYTSVEPITQKCRVQYKINVFENNKEKARFNEIHNIYYFTIEQIKMLLEQNGFEIRLIAPYLQNCKMKVSDWEIIIVAQKK